MRAATKPGMVNTFALIWTGSPNSRRVAEVTGPIEDMRTPSICGIRCFACPRAESKFTKFRTVEELVNVTTCGRRLGSFIIRCSRVRDDWAHGFVGLDHIYVRPSTAQFLWNDVPRDLGPNQQNPLALYLGS